MSFEEAKIKAERLRGRFDAPFSFSDKKEIEVMYWEVLGKRLSPTNCQQCYHDALIEIYLYLKNNNKMKEKSNYRLRAGFIINTPAFNNGKVYSNANLTDEVAESYLAKFPNQVKMFEALPKGFSIKSIQSKVKKAEAAKKAEEEAKKVAELEAEKNRKAFATLNTIIEMAHDMGKIADDDERLEALEKKEKEKYPECDNEEVCPPIAGVIEIVREVGLESIADAFDKAWADEDPTPVIEAMPDAAGSDEGAGEGTEEGTGEASPEENADGAPKAGNDAVGEE